MILLLQMKVMEQNINRLRAQLDISESSFVSRSALDREQYEVELEHLRLQANALVRKLVGGGSIVSEKSARVKHDKVGEEVYATKGVYEGHGVYVAFDSAEVALQKENGILRSDVKFLNRRVSVLKSLMTLRLLIFINFIFDS
jgi:polyhydroxyalkanoate synthesis regulator phasin